MARKVLITGITGMVGSHLADFLLKNTNQFIIGMCRWRSPTDNVAHLFGLANKKKRIKFVYGDLNDYFSIFKIIKNEKPDFIYHLAAQSFPLASFDMAESTFNTNINGTYNLLNSIKDSKINPWIHICSSSEIFGKVDKKNIPIKETTNYHPASPYAISKVGTDLISRFFFEAYNLKTLTTRMFTHTGPRRGDYFAESSFAKQIAMIEKKIIPPIVKVGNLKSLRTYSDVRDAVRAYYILLNKKPRAGQFYNIGGNYSCTVGYMLKTLIKNSVYKNKIKIQKDKSRFRPIDANLQIPDTRKFRSHYDWKPQIKFKKTMIDLLNYWREKVSKNNFLDR